VNVPVRVFFITWLLLLLANSYLLSQEVYTTQSWELSYDQQLNGWVDSGDHILITVEVSTYDTFAAGISLYNNLASPHLSLHPSSITTSHGQIINGSNKSIEVENISFNKVGEKAIVKFECQVDYNIDQVSEIDINNYSIIRTDQEDILTNSIHVSVRGQVNSNEVSFWSNSLNLIVCIIIALILAFGFMNSRVLSQQSQLSI